MACAQVCRKLPLPLASPVGYMHPRLMTPGGGAATSALEKHGSGLLLELGVKRTEVGPPQPSGEQSRGESPRAE